MNEVLASAALAAVDSPHLGLLLATEAGGVAGAGRGVDRGSRSYFSKKRPSKFAKAT